MLLVSLLPLFAAPFLHALCEKRSSLLHMLDGFIFVAIGGLIISGILPEVFHHGGWWSFAFLFLGLVLPVISEKVLHNEGNIHKLALILGMIGLFIHAMTDGAALVHTDVHGHGHGDGHDHAHVGDILSLGVLLHRIPIGLTIWWLVKPQFGKLAALGVLVMIAVGTVVGYTQVPAILGPLSGVGLAYFQAFVAGSLIHIVFHRPHMHDHGGHGGNRWSEGLGNLIGGGLVVYLASHHNHMQDSAWWREASHTFIDLLLESAPALLLAYLVAGVAMAFISQAYVDWMNAGRTWKQTLRGVAVGLPLPVCSCGVVPLYHTLIKRGAPPAAAMAFLVATPELGIDAILISLPLLGDTMTIARVVAAFVVALAIGILIGRITPKPNLEGIEEHIHPPERTETIIEKLKFGLSRGLGELVDHTGPWILVGLILAAGLQPILNTYLTEGINPWLEVPLFALIGMPLYVCASGATPMIAIFLINGVSPGAALAFLITGPATNLTTVAILSQLHGRRIAVLFGLATFAITVVLGYVANAVLPQFTPKLLSGEHVHGTPFQYFCLAILGLIFTFSLVRRGARAFLGELFSQGEHDHDHGDHHHHHHHGHSHDHHA